MGRHPVQKTTAGSRRRITGAAMKRIELHDLEYGECTVLCGKSEILMVDCGSISHHLREESGSIEACYDEIARRYLPYADRAFLLTHYHRDHLSGFLKILQNHPDYFSRIYLPCLPLDSHGGNPLLEYAIFSFLFSPPQTDSFQVNTTCIRIFSMIADRLSADRIFTLRAGDSFGFSGVTYDILSPRATDFSFDPELLAGVESMNVLFSSPFLSGSEAAFLTCKNRFILLYQRCCDAFSVSGRALPEKRRSLMGHLEDALAELMEMKAELALSPLSHDVQEILESPLVMHAYSATANAACVVFQNRREKAASLDDILMTGDCTPEVLSELSPMLYDSYYVLKAPHHGTASGYSRLFADIVFSHILITNGDYHAGGAVAQEYIDMQDSLKHCSNHNACKWYQTAGACCNRLTCCYDQPVSGGLAIQCPATRSGRDAGCSIYTIRHGNVRACLCDTAFVQEQRLF